MGKKGGDKVWTPGGPQAMKYIGFKWLRIWLNKSIDTTTSQVSRYTFERLQHIVVWLWLNVPDNNWKSLVFWILTLKSLNRAPESGECHVQLFNFGAFL